MLGGEHDPVKATAALTHSAGFIRARLGRELNLRVVPRLQFIYDESVARGSHLESLIDQVVAEDRANHGSGE